MCLLGEYGTELNMQSNNSWAKLKATLSSCNVGIMTSIGLNLFNNDLQRCLKFPLYYIM